VFATRWDGANPTLSAILQVSYLAMLCRPICASAEDLTRGRDGSARS
jgi:hypothetical protein